MRCQQCGNLGVLKTEQLELPQMPQATPEDLARVKALEDGRKGLTEGPEPWPLYFLCPDCGRKRDPAWLGAEYCWECQVYHA